MNRMNGTHTALIVAATRIGGIAECSAWYTYRLAERIERFGKCVDELTVRELIAIEAEEKAAVLAAAPGS